MTNTQIKQVTLYSYQAKEITLDAAISASQNHLKDAIALLYSPQKCQLAKFKEDSKLYDAYDRVIKLQYTSIDIFEARIFNKQGELRWLNRAKGTGDAAFISESEVILQSFRLLETQAVEALKQQYLLWGEKAKNPSVKQGWQRLASARIGKLDVPLSTPLKEKDRVFLNSIEYIAEVDQFGNCAIIEERLVNLEAK